MENFESPDAKVEYIFIERVEKQEKTINDEQGYLIGFINLIFKEVDYKAFKTLVQDQLNLAVKHSDYFQNKEINLDDYQFVLVDNEKNYQIFDVIDKFFYEALVASLRNLMIVGKNFDIEEFKYHDIFYDWYENYSNRF
jgi:hypothetical protein